MCQIKQSPTCIVGMKSMKYVNQPQSPTFWLEHNKGTQFNLSKKMRGESNSQMAEKFFKNYDLNEIRICLLFY